MSEGKIKCPMCAELINRNAEKCDFCGEPLVAPTEQPESTQSTSPKEPTLYSPNRAAAISVFLTPVFGAFCMMRNWQALKQEERASRSKLWMMGLTIYYALLFLFIEDENWLFCGLFGGVIVWSVLEVKAQTNYLKTNNIIYQKRSWVAPVLKGLCIAVIAVLGLSFLSGLLDPSPVFDYSSLESSIASKREILEYYLQGEIKELQDKEFRNEKISDDEMEFVNAFQYMHDCFLVSNKEQMLKWDGMTGNDILDECRKMIKTQNKNGNDD